MARMSVLQVVVPPPLRERIKAIADREGISQATVVREILTRGVRMREQISERRMG